MDEQVAQFILNADSKALATYGTQGINVVPVSSIKIVGETIWLVNYFMDKTIINITGQKSVSLVCWKGMAGYQIKGDVDYYSEGLQFDEVVAWIKTILPDRIVKGLLVLTPTEIYDIAPAKNTKEIFIS